jgi:hypothetical protein
MSVGATIRAAVPWTILAVSSAGMATIIVVAPQVGTSMVVVLAGVWSLLAMTRIAVIVRMSYSYYRRLGDAVV